MSGNAMEQGALGGKYDLEPRGSAFSLGIIYMANPSFTYYKCSVMLILKCSPCTAVAVQ